MEDIETDLLLALVQVVMGVLDLPHIALIQNVIHYFAIGV